MTGLPVLSVTFAVRAAVEAPSAGRLDLVEVRETPPVGLPK
jgi:hypothetical protein